MPLTFSASVLLCIYSVRFRGVGAPGVPDPRRTEAVRAGRLPGPAPAATRRNTSIPKANRGRAPGPVVRTLLALQSVSSKPLRPRTVRVMTPEVRRRLLTAYWTLFQL